MNVPSLRFSFMRHWPAHEKIKQSLRAQLLGKEIILPNHLQDREIEDTLDCLSVFMDLPVQFVSSDSDVDEKLPSIVVGNEESLSLRRIKKSSACVTIRLQDKKPNATTLYFPQEFYLLRDAVQEHLAQAGYKEIAYRIVMMDTPGTALAFASGQSFDPISGLINVLSYLLEGVDHRVSQWLLAIARQPQNPTDYLTEDALVMGKEEALRRAFLLGLIHEPKDDPAVFRAPLVALRKSGLVVDPSVIKQPFLARLFEQTQTPPSQKNRDELARRLAIMLEPQEHIPVVILHGNTHQIRRLAEQARQSLSTPSRWYEIGMQLNYRIEDVPRSRVAVFPRSSPDDRRKLATLLSHYWGLHILEDKEELSEEEFAECVPRGRGSCSILVLSETSQRAIPDAVRIEV